MTNGVEIIGYTVGTFDLLHIGHVRLLENCRSECGRLLVGVNSNGLAVASGKPMPVIPVAQRVEMVGALKCVDGVWEEPDIDKFNTWRKWGFHKLFIGDDWRGTEEWKGYERQFKGATDVEIVYLPYTLGVSSSLIREECRK